MDSLVISITYSDEETDSASVCDDKNAKNTATGMDARPFFRQNSVESIPNSNDVWTKRKTDVPSNDEPVILMETVLHRDWWHDPLFEDIDMDSDVYDVIDEIKSRVPKRLLGPLPNRPLPNPPRSGKLPTSQARHCITGPHVTQAAYDEYTSYEEYATHPESEVPELLLPAAEDDDDSYTYDDTINSHVMTTELSKSSYNERLVNSRFQRRNNEDGSTLKKQLPRSVRLPPIQKPLPKSRKRPNGVPKPITPPTKEITHEQSECMKCSEMVQIFKPLLVQNLLIHDILPHLHFLDNHDDLYAEMKTRSEKNAVVSLLDELEKSEELGKWEKFMDVLNICGYSFIVDNIRGYRFINHGYQKKYIKEIAPIIGKVISPPELMPHLMAHDLLSDTDKDNILCECNIRGDYAGAIMLLDRIPRKHKDWYIVFIQALEDAGLDDVAASLKIEKLMDNGRTKDCDGYEMFDRTNENTSPKTTHPITAPKCKEPPLIPPRIPIKDKRIVPIPKIDDQACTDEANVDEKEESKFSDLKEEINKLEQEEHELDVETSLLQKKSDCFKKVISHKKKKRQIHEEITSLEMENMALEQETEIYEEVSETQSCIDAYYPSGETSPKLMITNEVLDSMGFNDQPIPVAQTTANPLSPVPLYSLRFDKIRYIVHSDKDSGIGKVDENLEYVYDFCGKTSDYV